MGFPLQIEDHQVLVGRGALQSGSGPGRGLLGRAARVVTWIVALDVEVIKAGFPVPGLEPLPVSDMGLNSGPGDVDVFAQLYGSLAT